jgi:hypothetical protein
MAHQNEYRLSVSSPENLCKKSAKMAELLNLKLFYFEKTKIIKYLKAGFQKNQT